MKYVYNDGDGTTYYDREYAIQLSGFDSNFHVEHLAVQPLPFAEMRDTHTMLNGRGYPDTVLEAPIANGFNGNESQVMDAKVYAVRGERTVLRMSSLDVVRPYTLALDGIPMKIVGRDARMLRNRMTGENLPIVTGSFTLGGGSSVEIILDLVANDIPVGVYPLYTTNLNYLSNGDQDFGGMMTEVHVVDVLP
jgi:FtsP/CotA-like multicopper oxidase with cupredoxin domain